MKLKEVNKHYISLEGIFANEKKAAYSIVDLYKKTYDIDEKTENLINFFYFTKSFNINGFCFKISADVSYVNLMKYVNRKKFLIISI